MALKFTNINHEVRKRFEISNNEYVLIDMIYHLSVNPESKVKGWCYMSRTRMAEETGLSRSGIMKIIEKLIDDLLIRHEVTRYLKTSPKWNNEYFFKKTDGVKSVPKDGVKSKPLNGVQSVLGGGVKSKPNKNTFDNNSSNKNSGFIKPEILDVKLLFLKKGSTGNEAKKFFYFYESKGWKVGKNKMKNWEAAAGGWIARNKKDGKPTIGNYSEKDKKW